MKHSLTIFIYGQIILSFALTGIAYLYVYAELISPYSLSYILFSAFKKFMLITFLIYTYLDLTKYHNKQINTFLIAYYIVSVFGIPTRILASLRVGRRNGPPNI